MKEKILYGPGDWLGSRFTARQRRAIAAWALILIIFPGTPISYYWKDAIWMVWLLSIISLYFGLGGIVSAETPVEAEVVQD